MRYRIKIITYENGRKGYIPQKKALFGWIGVGYDGDVSIYYNFVELNSREMALLRIDKNSQGNTKKQSIEFEYVSF